MSELVLKTTWWFFVVLAVAPTIYILLTKNVMRAAFALLATFLGLAGLYVFLQAYFIAVAQLMVYVGGILVLIIFGIMLSTRKGTSFRVVTGLKNQLAGVAIFTSIVAGIGFLIQKAEWVTAPTDNFSLGKTEALGIGLMTKYILPFELVGIILLIALVAAVYISKDLKNE